VVVTRVQHSARQFSMTLCDHGTLEGVLLLGALQEDTEAVHDCPWPPLQALCVRSVCVCEVCVRACVREAVHGTHL